MAVNILLGFLCLSGCVILSRCRQYYFVNQPLNWGDAWRYCRQMNYIGLANIGNTEEMTQLITTVSFAGYSSQCQTVSVTGGSWSYLYPNCSLEYPFICYNGTLQSPQYVFVNVSMDWFRALRYCRENFADLPPNGFYYYQLQTLLPTGVQTWTGLIGRPIISWGGGSFRYWDDSKKISGISDPLFGVADLQRSGKWSLISYYTTLPFVCYNELPAVLRKRKVIKMKLKDSSEDLNDVKANLLKKLQDRLKENGVDGVTLKWSEQPDGAVFHKEEKKTEP